MKQFGSDDIAGLADRIYETVYDDSQWAGLIEDLKIHLNGSQTPQINWAKPATEWFKMAFRRIRREVLGQERAEYGKQLVAGLAEALRAEPFERLKCPA